MPVSNTDRLTMADIGRVPRDGHRGVFGQMNTGLITCQPKPSAVDVSELADLFGVKSQQVRRWLGKADQYGRTEYRACVPLRLRGQRVALLNNDDLLRVLLAACFGAPGGLIREPIFTRGDKQTGEPFREVFPFLLLSECVEHAAAIHSGEFDALLQQAWVQMWIEFDHKSDQWQVVLLYNYPKDGEYEDLTTPEEEAANAAMGEGTEQ